MSYARQLLDTYPNNSRIDGAVLVAAIDALGDCVQACTADVDADLSESDDIAHMVKCIRLCLNCTDICAATLGVLSRPAEWDAGVVRPLVQACVAICKSCGDECERHAPTMAHCRVCEESCRRCEKACRELLSAMA
jgi:hypothetical protein